jgi:hypothetical protein
VPILFPPSPAFLSISVRSCIEEGKLEVEHVETKEQHAHILTKALRRFRFQELKEKIGIQLVGSGHQAFSSSLRGRIVKVNLDRPKVHMSRLQ